MFWYFPLKDNEFYVIYVPEDDPWGPSLSAWLVPGTRQEE